MDNVQGVLLLITFHREDNCKKAFIPCVFVSFNLYLAPAWFSTANRLNIMMILAVKNER